MFSNTFSGIFSNMASLALILSFGCMQQAAAPGAAPVSQEPPKTVVAAVAAPAAAAAPSEAMTTLYFYRPRLYWGGAVRIGLVDGTPAVNLVNGRWASIQVPAGHHIIKPKDDQSGVEIDSEPGQSHYFRAGWGEAGLFHNAHKTMMIVMKEQATYEIKQLKPLDEKDVSWHAPISK